MQTPDRPRITVGSFITKKSYFLSVHISRKTPESYPAAGYTLKKLFAVSQREIKEEANMTITKLKFLGIQKAISPKEFSKHPHLVLLDFCAKLKSKTDKLNDEAEEFSWASPQKSLQLKLGKYTRVLIKNFIKPKKR